jgi:hypothetical protein
LKHLAAVAAACSFLLFAPPLAHATSLNDARLGHGRAELVAQARHSQAVLDRLTAPQRRWRLALRHRSCWSHVPWSRRCDRARRKLIRHRRLLALSRHRLAALAPPVAHLAGWSCITNGAYPGAPHEGNGYNGPYVGPLGMTDPWAGYSSPGPDWHLTPVLVVYAIAEKVAAAHGFDPGWMSGQWPNTYPPCADRF